MRYLARQKLLQEIALIWLHFIYDLSSLQV